MKETTKLLLDQAPFYIMYSNKTGRPYFNRDFEVYFFDSEIQGKDVCEKIEDDVCIKGPFYFKGKNTPLISSLTDLYLNGITKINFVFSNQNGNPPSDTIEKKDVKDIYYNEYAQRRILCLKQWNESQYLYDLQNTTFLIPIEIKSRGKNKFPEIKYGAAHFDDTDRHVCYILFSTLELFKEWNKMQNDKFSPVEIDLAELESIRKGDPVCINPLTDKLYLTNEHLKKSGSRRIK